MECCAYLPPLLAPFPLPNHPLPNHQGVHTRSMLEIIAFCKLAFFQTMGVVLSTPPRRSPPNIIESSYVHRRQETRRRRNVLAVNAAAGTLYVFSLDEQSVLLQTLSNEEMARIGSGLPTVNCSIRRFNGTQVFDYPPEKCWLVRRGLGRLSGRA